jgi:hypothetical protein
MCPHADLNRTTTAPDGTPVRCLSAPSGYNWVVDTGVTQTDPAIAGQRAWAECIARIVSTDLWVSRDRRAPLAT